MISKLTIIGSGISGALEAYYAYKKAQLNNEKIRITMLDKNSSITETTVYNIAPSLTPDEILSVVPPATVLLEKLRSLFSEPGGIRVDDVENVNDTKVANDFITQVEAYNLIKDASSQREQALLQLGKISMELWQEIYQSADKELKQVFIDANFHPCHEPDGYRIDLIYDVPNPKAKAEAMCQVYANLGYKKCQILSPDQVKKLDPFLTYFCDEHSKNNIWHDSAIALYRPGGCLNTEIFLPRFYGYLEKAMGKYTNENNKEKNYFKLKFNREVSHVEIEDNRIIAITYGNTTKKNKRPYITSEYVFCPGEAVGTLAKLGFNEPAYTGFAGASLKLNIPVSHEYSSLYNNFNHYMEIHRDGIVLSYQGKFKNGQISLGVGGTKAFYADQKASKNQDFAKNRNLLQLNMLNDVSPAFVSLALNRKTHNQQLSADDLQKLEDVGIAQRWVGIRAVAYDGFPTWGNLYKNDTKIVNARTTTHLGSGGVSFAPAAVLFSCSTHVKHIFSDYADSRRSTILEQSKLKSKL